jgi:hypothetical protein
MSTSFRRTLLVALVGCGPLVASTAFAQARIGVFGTAGFGGEAEASVDLESGVDPADDGPELQTSLGLGASYDTPVTQLVSLGGLLRIASWEAHRYTWEVDGDNTGWAFDFAFLPRLRFEARGLEFYAAVPLGLTLATKEDNLTFFAIDTEYDVGFGYNLGVFGGVQIPLEPNLALFAELGWLGRGITQQGHAQGDSSADGELEYSTGQFAVNFGVAFF